MYLNRSKSSTSCAKTSVKPGHEMYLNGKGTFEEGAGFWLNQDMRCI